MNLKTLTEASQLTTICAAGMTAPGVGTPCLPAHVSFIQNLIFHTVGRRYSSGNSILRGVPLFPPSYSSILQNLLKANLACCYFVALPPSQTISYPQLSTVSMLLSHLRRQTWLCETTTPWVLGAVVVTSTTRAALEVTTSLPPTTPRGATNWLVMMTTTTKLQTGQHAFQVGAVVRFFLNRDFFQRHIVQSLRPSRQLK